MNRKLTSYDADAIRAAVSIADLVEPMKEAFRIEAAGTGESTISVLSPRGDDGDVHLKAAWLPGHPWFVIKVATGFVVGEGDADRSTQLGGYLALHDAYDGALSALLFDGHVLTDFRTAAASAAATDALAPADSSTVAVLGTGTQALLQGLATARVRPITRVVVWGRRQDAARRLAERIRLEEPRLEATVVDSAREAVDMADVVITTTSSRTPIVRGEWLRPGQHITSSGADDPTKFELDLECFAVADVIGVDSPRHTPQAAGDLRAALAGSTANRSHATVSALGDLLDEPVRSMRDDQRVSIAKLVGTATQDLLAAEVALRQLNAAVPGT